VTVGRLGAVDTTRMQWKFGRFFLRYSLSNPSHSKAHQKVIRLTPPHTPFCTNQNSGSRYRIDMIFGLIDNIMMTLIPKPKLKYTN